MSRRHSAVDRVVGTLFDRGRKKEQHGPDIYSRQHRGGGSHRRPSLSRMSHVGGKHGKAIFKLVTRGGTVDRSGLKGQMKYVFNDEKMARVFDSSGRLDPHSVVENKDINRITLDWSNDWWANTRNGNTSHMILSYPHGTSIDDVAGITEAVCHELLGSGERTFKYVGAIHEDRNNPHAHIIVNRRADDNTLLHMRSGTELSYEGFREAMAAHAARRGIELDPTFRFERGVRAAQPTRNEQILAQKQGREPEQKSHSTKGLVYVNDQISNAKIMYNAMAVIAANADCSRLENTYRSLAHIIETADGDFKMPELNADELQRFDEYTAILNETLERTEKVLARKDPAVRASHEGYLDKVMQSLTSLHRDASYAEGLHTPARSNSIYMHDLLDGEALRSTEVQDMLKQVELQHGLKVDVMTQRLLVNEPSERLEQQWLADDVRTIGAFRGMDFSDPTEHDEIIEDLTNAHEALREDLVEAKVVQLIPHLHDGYEWKPEPSPTYSFVPDRLEREVAETIKHYKDAGAPEEWIAENKAEIQNDVEARFNQERNDFLQANMMYAQPMYQILGRDGGDIVIADKKAASQLSAEIEARGFGAVDRDAMKSKIGKDLHSNEKDMPHHVADDLARAYTAIYELERGAQQQDRHHEAFAHYAAISPAGYSIAKNSEEFDALMERVKEHTTPDQYERLVSGDLRAIEHITTDPLLARQIAAEVVVYEQGQGRVFTVVAEDAQREHREYVAEKFDLGRGGDNGYER